MSNYTLWIDLTIEPEDSSIIERVVNDPEVKGVYPFDADGSGLTWESWFSEYRESTMKRISLEYPGVLFLLEIEDDEGQQWREYYKDGKSCGIPGEIVFAEFSEEMLQ